MTGKPSTSAATLVQRYDSLRNEFRAMEQSLFAARDATRALFDRLEDVLADGKYLACRLQTLLRVAKDHAVQRTHALARSDQECVQSQAYASEGLNGVLTSLSAEQDETTQD